MTSPEATDQTADGTNRRNLRNFVAQGAIAHQAWILSSPSVVMAFIAVSLELPIFLAGSLVALRHTAGTLIDVFAVGVLSQTRDRKRVIMLADVGIGLCYIAFVYSLFWDNKVAIGIAFSALLLVIGAIHEVKVLMFTPFMTENLSSKERMHLRFLQVLLGGIGAIAVVVVTHAVLASNPALERHALVVTVAAACFFLSAIGIMSIRDIATPPANGSEDTPKKEKVEFFSAFRALLPQRWFRQYLLLRMLFVMMGLSVPIFALVTAQAHHGTAKGLTALVISSAAALTISAPLWRYLNGFSYRLSMICGALMIVAAGAILVFIKSGAVAEPIYLHAAAVFVATAATAGLSNARELFFLDIAPKDQLLAAVSVTKSIARFAIIGFSTGLAAIAHTKDSIWSVVVIAACAAFAVAACIALVPASEAPNGPDTAR